MTLAVESKSQQKLNTFFGGNGTKDTKKRDTDNALKDGNKRQKISSDSESQGEEVDEDEDDTDLNEAAKKIKPIPTTSSWPNGAPVPYSYLAQSFTAIEATTKRLEIMSHTSKLYFTVLETTPDNLLQVVYLTINRLCPDYEGIELGTGETILIKAVAECTGRTTAQIKTEYQKTGDLGTVAETSRNNQPTMFKPQPLTVPYVFKSLKEIAGNTGKDSQTRKIAIIKRLLSACVGNEARFLIRSLEGKLRIRLAEKTVLSSLASAIVAYEARRKDRDVKVTDISEGEAILKDVFNELPSYDIIIPAMLRHGIKQLKENCKLEPGVPLKPMLAKPTKSISEVLDRFEGHTFTSEFKYDGERAQIHRTNDGKIMVYSRNSEDMTKRYPDILSGIGASMKENVQSFVLDCEAVAWDREKQSILPFQVLSTRKRKDVREEEIKVRVCLFAFDLLYFNGASLLQTPFEERRRLLRDHFLEVKGEFTFAEFANASSIEEIQIFLELAVKKACEGLMVKMLQGPSSFYEPSKRSQNWLKIKKDYMSGLGDSLDLVVLGAFHGKGKRTSVYGAYMLGCYNPDRQQYETICKIGTGFSDEVLESHFQSLSPHVIQKARSDYVHAVGGQQPDVWFTPTMVWEVLAADLSLSPVYKAAITKMGGDKGVSLRFPRFIRIREDKSTTDATTSTQVAELFRSQTKAEPAVDDNFEY